MLAIIAILSSSVLWWGIFSCVRENSLGEVWLGAPLEWRVTTDQLVEKCFWVVLFGQVFLFSVIMLLGI